MRKYLMESGWIQKTVRITNDYNKLCSFFEFYAKENNLDPSTIYNEAVLFSLDHLITDGFHYRIIPFDGRREPKGFLLEESTLELLLSNYNMYKDIYYRKENKKLLIAEFYELLFYIYCYKKIDKKYLLYINDVFNIKWGIEDLKDIQ